MLAQLNSLTFKLFRKHHILCSVKKVQGIVGKSLMLLSSSTQLERNILFQSLFQSTVIAANQSYENFILEEYLNLQIQYLISFFLPNYNIINFIISKQSNFLSLTIPAAETVQLFSNNLYFKLITLCSILCLLSTKFQFYFYLYSLLRKEN